MTDQEIDLNGIYLSDDMENPTKYQITSDGTEASTLIPAHGYKIIWCDKLSSLNQLHVDFKLENADGALVMLTAADRSWADTLIYCAHEGRESVGRFPDGGNDLYRMPRPTIGKANTWNSYTEKWEGTLSSLEEKRSLIANNGAMSITYKGNALYIRSEEDPNVTLQIYTPSGEMVMSQKLWMDNGKSQVSLSPLPAGTYIASITDSEGIRCAVKVLIK